MLKSYSNIPTSVVDNVNIFSEVYSPRGAQHETTWEIPFLRADNIKNM